MFRFNDLLREAEIPVEETAILLHTPKEKKLARLLPFFAAQEPDMLDAYQKYHNVPATATLRRKRFVAVFVRVHSGRLAFIGLYRINGLQEVSSADLAADPHMQRLMEEFGANLELLDPKIPTRPVFDFERLNALTDYVGRVQISPNLKQSYVRLAETLDPVIVELSAESVLAADPPDWRSFIVSGPEVRTLPASWADCLRQWRGIYCIIDQLDGQRYVGSAYGEKNLLGRWAEHVSCDEGQTVRLRTRDPVNFVFSILERVSPDMPSEDVIKLEHSWMDRLNTRTFGLNS